MNVVFFFAFAVTVTQKVEKHKSSYIVQRIQSDFKDKCYLLDVRRRKVKATEYFYAV